MFLHLFIQVFTLFVQFIEYCSQSGKIAVGGTGSLDGN
jgi:hypothetical protein